MTLPQWYLSVLKKYKDELLRITDILVADAAFSTKAFADGLRETGFHLISRLRKDAVLFSTDSAMRGIDVYDTYRTRFQIESCFPDGHHFTGLRDCQSRDEKTLDFAFNASFAAINITKVLIKEYEPALSIGKIKSCPLTNVKARGCGFLS